LELAPLEHNEVNPSPLNAEELIVDILMGSDVPVDFIFLGPMTNLARALMLERRIADKIGTLYVSGTNFDGRSEKPGSFPYSWKTSGSNWNTFADALAAQRVFNLGKPMFLMTGQAQNDLLVDPDLVWQLQIDLNLDSWIAGQVALFANCTGQPDSSIQYWDPSAAVMMINLLEDTPDLLCTEWDDINMIVVLNEGGSFGRTYEDPTGVPAKICRHTNLTYFLDEYWPTVAGVSQCPPVDNTDWIASSLTLADAIAQIAMLTDQLTSLQTMLNDKFYSLDMSVSDLTNRSGALEDRSDALEVRSDAFEDRLTEDEYILNSSDSTFIAATVALLFSTIIFM